jgi:hypothetical protein
MVIAITALLVMASSPATADDTPGFYSGAGHMPEGGLNLQLVPASREPLPTIGGYRFNSRFRLEGSLAEIKPITQLSEHSSQFSTQSFLGTGLADNAISTTSRVALVTTLTERGPVRPFARAGLHKYEFEDGSGQHFQGDSVLLGAGANIDLSQGWNAKLEWERYGDVDRQDRNVFSASFEYKF